jgi:hypothetical protein
MREEIRREERGRANVRHGEHAWPNWASSGIAPASKTRPSRRTCRFSWSATSTQGSAPSRGSGPVPDASGRPASRGALVCACPAVRSEGPRLVRPMHFDGSLWKPNASGVAARLRSDSGCLAEAVFGNRMREAWQSPAFSTHKPKSALPVRWPEVGATPPDASSFSDRSPRVMTKWSGAESKRRRNLRQNAGRAPEAHPKAHPRMLSHKRLPPFAAPCRPTCWLGCWPSCGPAGLPMIDRGREVRDVS